MKDVNGNVVCAECGKEVEEWRTKETHQKH
jgi:DNA-directed RNA polymerase subunit RPC12/RpoP